LAVWIWSTPDIGKADQSEYLALGQNIRLHGTFSYGVPHRWGDGGTLNTPGPFEPSAARAPLYPLFIAALWWHDTPPLRAIRLVQALLGACVAALVYLTALRAFGSRAAMFAGLAATLAPLTIFTTTVLLTETLFSFLLMLGLWFWGRQQGFVAGLLIGMATLTRAVLSPLLGVVALLAVVLKFNRATHVKLLLGALLVIAPWTARNAATQHAFIPVASMGWGANVLLATVDVPYGAGNVWAVIDQGGASTKFVRDSFADAIRTSSSEAQAESRMFAAGMAEIAKAPVHWFLVRLKQYPRLFVGAPNYLGSTLPVSPGLLKVIFGAGGIAFFVLAVAGLFLARRRWREIYHLALFPIVLCVAQFPALTEERYSLGIVPMSAIFAGFALSKLVEKTLSIRSGAALRTS
jgi:4-amino-4-deoxy-L-arabinose transferase-like glycosyltransferase